MLVRLQFEHRLLNVSAAIEIKVKFYSLLKF